MLQGLYKGQEVRRGLPLSLYLHVCMCSVYNYSVLCVTMLHSSHHMFYFSCVAGKSLLQ